MGFEWVSDLDCPACGVTEHAAVVKYDRLGYPVCPDCGATTAPTPRGAREAPGIRGAR